MRQINLRAKKLWGGPEVEEEVMENMVPINMIEGPKILVLDDEDEVIVESGVNEEDGVGVELNVGQVPTQSTFAGLSDIVSDLDIGEDINERQEGEGLSGNTNDCHGHVGNFKRPIGNPNRVKQCAKKLRPSSANKELARKKAQQERERKEKEDEEFLQSIEREAAELRERQETEGLSVEELEEREKEKAELRAREVAEQEKRDATNLRENEAAEKRLVESKKEKSAAKIARSIAQ